MPFYRDNLSPFQSPNTYILADRYILGSGDYFYSGDNQKILLMDDKIKVITPFLVKFLEIILKNLYGVSPNFL
jgi:hypothetical protein